VKRIWAPWRMSFILEYDKTRCIFCDLPKEEDKDRDNLILYRTKRTFVLMNKFPYNNGHLMVAPLAHSAKIADIDNDTLHELIDTLKFTAQNIGKTFSSEGMNIGINEGKVAGAGYADHLHFHVVPRWRGDTNFMPVIGETKVMAEHLHNTYDKLAPLFKK
jgi:ATP adenylyltransferase